MCNRRMNDDDETQGAVNLIFKYTIDSWIGISHFLLPRCEMRLAVLTRKMLRTYGYGLDASARFWKGRGVGVSAPGHVIVRRAMGIAHLLCTRSRIF